MELLLLRPICLIECRSIAEMGVVSRARAIFTMFIRLTFLRMARGHLDVAPGRWISRSTSEVPTTRELSDVEVLVFNISEKPVLRTSETPISKHKPTFHY